MSGKAVKQGGSISNHGLNQSPLRRLPLEVREEIYERVLKSQFVLRRKAYVRKFTTQRQDDDRFIETPSFTNTNLLLSCRKIHKEATLVLYRINKFHLESSPEEQNLDEEPVNQAGFSVIRYLSLGFRYGEDMERPPSSYYGLTHDYILANYFRNLPKAFPSLRTLTLNHPFNGSYESMWGNSRNRQEAFKFLASQLERVEIVATTTSSNLTMIAGLLLPAGEWAFGSQCYWPDIGLRNCDYLSTSWKLLFFNTMKYEICTASLLLKPAGKRSKPPK